VVGKSFREDKLYKGQKRIDQCFAFYRSINRSVKKNNSNAVIENKKTLAGITYHQFQELTYYQFQEL